MRRNRRAASSAAFLLIFLCGSVVASDRAEVGRILKLVRTVAEGGSSRGGIRPALSPALLDNPRLALPHLNDTDFLQRLKWYAPFARTREDQAATAIGLWIATHAETIAAAPDQKSDGDRITLVWPGSLLVLERTPDGLRIAGTAETAATPPLVRPPPADGPARRQATIVFTNDIHGYLLPYPDPWSKAETRPIVGGVTSIATYVRRCRAIAAAQDVPLFLFDAGDLYQGTPEGTLTKGSVMVPVMNSLSYDAIAIGNHEYDHGRQNAERLVAALKAPVLGANVFDSTTRKLEKGLRRRLVLDRGGVRVGLTGILTTHMRGLTFAKNILNLDFRPHIPTLAGILPDLHAANPDLMILLSHTGFQEDTALADAVPGIDIILGGHSHTEVETAWIAKNRTVVVQTQGKASHIGRMDVLILPGGGVDTFVWQLVPLTVKAFPPDRRIGRVIGDATRGVTAEMGRVIGRSDTDIPYAYRKESAMGRLTTDLLRAWAGADIAILAGGGMRAGFIPGPIAVRDCFQVFPFGNPLAVADVRGAALLRVLEHGVSTDRGRIQVSGVTILADTSLPRGRRIVEVRVADVPIDTDRTYRVVTDGFLAQGGSGFFAKEPIDWDIHTEQTPFDLLRDHVARVGDVRAPAAERIRYRQ